MQKTASIFLAFILSITIYAQPLAIKHLEVKNGLSNNYIVDIAQDQPGCIWIATESGLNKFDGRHFTAYTSKNSDLISNELNALLFDKEENTLWIGTQRDGISLFNSASQTFTNLTIKEGLLTNDVTNLSKATDGGIWITHYHVGIEYYDKTTKKLTRYRDKNIEGMKSLNWCSVDDGKGNLYVGHAFDGVSIVDIENKTARNLKHEPGNPYSLPGNTVRAICIDKFKNIWLGTDQGLSLFNPKKDEFITFKHDPANPHSLGSNSILSITEMNDGTLWIGTDMSGVSILDLNNLTLRDPQLIDFKNITSTESRNDLSSVSVKCIFQDSFENVWIGNSRKGIDFISRIQPKFHVIPYAVNANGEVSDKQIWSMYVDTNNQVWIGGDRELALYKTDKLITIFDINRYLSGLHRYIKVVKSDNKGKLWLGIYPKGILKLNPISHQIEQAQTNILDNANIHDFFEDKEGKMWISTELGLYSYHNGKYIYEEKITNSLEDKTIYSFIRDQQGKIWIGTFGKGLHVFDKEGNLITIFSTENGFCSNAVNHLYMDHKGDIWAATRNGLVHFKNDEKPAHYILYNEEQGIENSHILAIREDVEDNIWVSTNAGISLLHKEKKKFDNFNHDDGIPSGDFINGSAYSDTDGNLFFASINGACFFNPGDLKAKHQISPVQIISSHFFSKKIENLSEELLIPSNGKGLNLPYDRNSLRIIFGITDYAYSGQMEYMYMLDGLDKMWYNIQDENQITFRNIPPGQYTFRIKARLKNQEWDESGMASLSIHIHPPIWLTWYAKLLYILSLCAIGYYVIRSYKKKLQLKASLELERKNSHNKQELNDERLRFYTNVTHELRTPLTLILGPLEDVLYDENLPEYFRKKISVIYGSSLRLLNLINQILEFRKTETQNRQLTVAKGNLANLVTEIGLRYKELNQNGKVMLHTYIETAETVLYFDADMINTILNNLLSNALKYTLQGEIRLLMRSVSISDKKYTEIEVSDTGYGIDSTALPYIFDRYYQAKGKHQASGTGIGLALVKSLVELHEGELHVSSMVGKGTSFVFRLLTENTYPKALHAESKNTYPDDISFSDSEENTYETSCMVLVIEDNAEIQQYIASSLSDDYKVITAVDGKEGLELAQQHIPDIIISDIMMPQMNGIEFCTVIKRDIRTSHIPVILLTAKDSIQDREEGYKSGADSYLTKPFSARLLRSRMVNLLESRKKFALQIVSHATNSNETGFDISLPELDMNKLDKDFLTKLTAIIEENLDLEKLDVIFLREKMYMSGSSFYRKVKGLTGLSPNEFIRKIRIRKAALLLLSGKHNVSEVSYLAGFNDVAYFRQCFKGEYGVTPTEFVRKKCKQ
jgi:signal transduction histidine kinase/ligand-binding sensor domain-containing protein/DNA-binding response OmpR family regulator